TCDRDRRFALDVLAPANCKIGAPARDLLQWAAASVRPDGWASFDRINFVRVVNFAARDMVASRARHIQEWRWRNVLHLVESFRLRRPQALLAGLKGSRSLTDQPRAGFPPVCAAAALRCQTRDIPSEYRHWRRDVPGAAP